MTENFRPHPENPKQLAPEAGAGPLGIPPPLIPEQQSHEGGSKSPELPPRQTNAQELEILAKLQKAKEFLGKLPYPLAPEMLEEMIRSAVRKINWEEMQRQIDKMDEEMMEVLQDPIQRRKFLEGD